MRKSILTAAFCLMVALSGFAAQNEPKKAKAEKPPVDCTAVDDAMITAKVKERLAGSKSLQNADINVATAAGVVTITGSVKTPGLKGAVTRMARRVDCVRKVDNQLAVQEPIRRKKPESGS